VNSSPSNPPSTAAPSRIVLEETIATALPNVTDYLAEKTGLSKGRIKHALNCGALRVKKTKGGFQRVRRATASVPAASKLSFHYDEQILSLKPAQPTLLQDQQQYSLWLKPPGVLAQGSEWGDHCSLLRLVELHFQQHRQCFLVHRLDREACGLMLVAHSGQMADKLSQLFATRAMEKHYRVRVQGDVLQDSGTLSSPLDGKQAITHYQVLSRSAGTSLLAVRIETGRLHQIRRHLSGMGHPVLGDARYGESAHSILHLAAVRLSFQCPVQGRLVVMELDPARTDQWWR